MSKRLIIKCDIQITLIIFSFVCNILCRGHQYKFWLCNFAFLDHYGDILVVFQQEKAANTVVITSHFSFCISERQPEAKALVQTSQTASSNTTDDLEHLQQNGAFPHPSTWTGLVDLVKEEFISIADNESSEISGEHVVIHLRPRENPASQEILMSEDQSPSVLEVHGGSAREEPDERKVTEDHRLSLEPSLTTPSSFTQAQTSNSMLFNFVESIMKPWKYWKGSAETEAPSAVSGLWMETSEEVQTARVKSGGGLRGTKGSIDNAILDSESMEPSTNPSTPYSEERLLEQEKEMVLPVPVNELKNPSKFQTEPSLTQPTASKGKNTLQFICCKVKVCLAIIIIGLVSV